MPKYYNEVTGEIVDYPADAAKVIPALKPVPSERVKSESKPAEIESSSVPSSAPKEDSTPKNGKN